MTLRKCNRSANIKKQQNHSAAKKDHQSLQKYCKLLIIKIKFIALMFQKLYLAYERLLYPAMTHHIFSIRNKAPSGAQLTRNLGFKGLGRFPNKQETLKSAEAEMSVFRIWRAISIACDFCRGKVCGHTCIACQGYTKFGIIVASNASVYTNAKNHPFRLHGTNGFSAC